jgi:hypothetical protein
MAEAARLMTAPETNKNRMVLQAHRALLIDFQRKLLSSDLRQLNSAKQLLC